MPDAHQSQNKALAAKALPAAKSPTTASNSAPLSLSLTQDTIQRAMSDPAALDATSVASLQRSMGNQAVSSLLAQRHKVENPSQAIHSLQVAGQSPVRVQRKLTVGAAHDRYEEEADRISGELTKNSVRRSVEPSPTKRAGAKDGLVQREVSSKQGQIVANLGTLFSTKKAAKEDKQGVEDYLAGLDAKQTDKSKRKEQKQEKSQLKSLLHFKKSETKTTTEDQRVMIRTIITIARSKGHGFAALEELRGFLTEYLVNGTIKLSDLKSYLNGDSAGVATMIKWGKTWGGSIDMLNVFASHAPELQEKQQLQVAKLIAAARAIQQRAQTATQGSNETAIIRARGRIKELVSTADELEQVAATGDYVRTRTLMRYLTSLYTVVTQAVHYGENLGKSPYSKDTVQGPGRQLGGGAFSKVMEVNYDPTRNQTNKPLNITHGVFKQEQVQYDWGSSRSAGFSGISEYDPNFAGRSVASYEVDKLLGLGLTPETQYGTHEGMGGSVQGWAQGKEPQKSVWNEELEVEQTKYREFDYDDPELQRQLATLQLLDLITGQVDRHPGNYYISQGPGGTKVIAIDNDIAFGENKDIQRLIDDTWGSELAEDNTRGMPLFVDQAVADNVLATSPQDLLQAIAHHGLTENEKAKTLVRFAQVKTHLNKLKANTAKINAIKQRMATIYAKRKLLPNDDPRTERVDSMIADIEKKQAEIFGQGALLGPTEWGATTAAYLTAENSYYGMLMQQVEYHRSIGMMLDD